MIWLFVRLSTSLLVINLVLQLLLVGCNHHHLTQHRLVQLLGTQFRSGWSVVAKLDVREGRQSVNVDGEVDILRNKALIVLELFGVQLAHRDADNMAAQVKNRATRVAFVDFGGELESAFVILQPGALGYHAVGQGG